MPVDLRTDFHVTDAVSYFKPPRTPAMQAAMATYPFQMLLEFVQYPIWVLQPALPGENNNPGRNTCVADRPAFRHSDGIRIRGDGFRR